LLLTTSHPTCDAVEALYGCFVLSHVALKHRSMSGFGKRETKTESERKGERERE
jgi:hypothetical protein